MKKTRLPILALACMMLFEGAVAAGNARAESIHPSEIAFYDYSMQANNSQYTSGVFRTDLAAAVVDEVNMERAKRGLQTLRMDAELTRAAQVRAAEIVKKFSHTRPDGTSWSTVSKSAYGENIAKGQRTVDRVMASWMSSDGHRRSILKASYGSIGVSAYVHNGIVYWVQLFGK